MFCLRKEKERVVLKLLAYCSYVEANVVRVGGYFASVESHRVFCRVGHA